MGIRRYKPTSPGRRKSSVSDFAEITTSEPEKSLLEPIKKTGGRNNQGRITSRHRGGGHKRRYRVIDFRRDKDGVPATVKTIEYDPNRSVRIALLVYADGEKRYILAPAAIRVGQVVLSGTGAEPKPGNAMALRDIPTGLPVHNIEMYPGRGGQLVRAAGSVAQLMAKEYSHPLGGGEGRAGAGRPPCSPTGKLSKGGKTRSPRKNSDRMIVRRRKKKKR